MSKGFKTVFFEGDASKANSLLLWVFLFLLSQRAFASSNLYVFYSKLKGGQQSILNRVFRPKLKTLTLHPQIKEIIEHKMATVNDLTRALQDPQAYGIIF